MTRNGQLLSVALIFGVAFPVAAQETGRPLAFTHVTVINCADSSAKPDMTVIVSKDRITTVGKSADTVVPKDAIVIDARHRFMIPGLWDMHVHVRPYETPLFIANGVTGVRIMFGRQRDIEARDLVRDRAIYIPDRDVACAPLVDESFDRRRDGDVIQVTTEAQARKAVQTAKRIGFDSVKISSNLKRELYVAVASEAKRKGIPIVGHVPDPVSPGFASEQGQKSIEHLTGISIGCSRFAGELQKLFAQTQGGGQARGDLMIRARETYDEETAQQLFANFVRNGTWQCPTLTLYQARSRAADPTLFQDTRLQFIPDWESNRWNRDLRTMAEYARNPALKFEHTLRLVGALHKAGVRILAGTDTANPYCFQGFGIHDELELLVRAGLPPSAALQTATRNPAEYMGRLGELGTVESGKIADLVLLDKNPLEDIKNTRQIAGVVLRGFWYPQTKLQQMLNQAKLTAKIANIGGQLKRDATQAHQPVVEVKFSSKRITDEQISQIRGFPELKHLGLSNSQITNDQLAIVSELPELRRLHLINTNVTDAGLAELGHLKNLEQLWLGSTKITDEGLKSIAAIGTLQELAFTNTQIGDEGVAHLKSLHGLTELWLSGTRTSDAGLQHLRNTTRLKVLALRDTQVSDAGLAHLSRLTNLERLVLTACHVSDAGLQDISRLRNLKVLRLSHTHVTDAGLKHLSGLSKLSELWLDGTRVSEAGISDLKQTLPNLEVRYSPYGRLTATVARSADDAEELSNGIMHVDSFDLELVRDEGLRIVGTGKQVIGLRFRNIDILRDSRLKKAYVQFTAREADADRADLTIQAELSVNAASFGSARGDITKRVTTPISVKWSPPPWKKAGDHGEAQRTPDIASLARAVMSQSGWIRGGSLVLIIKGDGRRVAETYDSNPTAAATLYIEYE